MQIILKGSPCVVPPAPMNQESRLLDEGGIYPLSFTRQESEIVTSAKQRPYLFGSVKMPSDWLCASSTRGLAPKE